MHAGDRAVWRDCRAPDSWQAIDTLESSFRKRQQNCGASSVGLGAGRCAKTAARDLAPLQSRTDSEVISPTAMAGGNTGLVLCQVGGQ